MKTQVLYYDPDLTFFEFSINDAHIKFKTPVERSAANLDHILRALCQQNPNTAIVLQIMNMPGDAPNGNRSFSDRPRLEAFNENYRAYARQNSVALLDNSPGWQHLKNNEAEKFHAFLPDGLHPSPDGEVLITWPNLQSLLEQARASQ